MKLRESLSAWIGMRLPILGELSAFLHQKSVPRHKYSFFYLLGGLALFFFLVQLLSGILLAFYYTPTPEGAHESVRYIITEVQYGWLVRSLHSWGANFMVATVLLHMIVVYFMKAYRKPRELMWLSGVVLLLLVLGFAFTGYLLPWDTTAYFATLIGTEIPRSTPVVGELAIALLRGGDEVGAEALKRMYVIHVVLLPLSIGIFLAFHVGLQQLYGSASPVGVTPNDRGIPFYPNFVYRDLITWVISLIVLLGFATLMPWGLAEKADPYASAPAGIKPEWYFLPLYETLKRVPVKLLFVDGEVVVNTLVGFVLLLWGAVPFLDRKAQREERSPFFTVIGLLVILYLALSTTLAYLSS